MYNQCASPRCSVLLTHGKWCPLHQPKQTKIYNTAEEKQQHSYYASNAHKYWRETVLHRDPLCQACLRKGILTPSTVAHHKDNNWRNIDLNNGEGLCASCHMPQYHQDEIGKEQRVGGINP